jgi:predicted CoA-binding protein
VPTVAVIGASRERHKYGNRAVRAYLRQGWTVYPINPTEPEVEGLATFPSVAEVPGTIDRASLYVPATIGITLLAGIKQKQIGEVWVNPGAESDELIAEAERLGLNTIQACSIIDIGERP